MIIFEAHKNNH